MKISNLRITPKLGILVAMAILGLAVAGAFAASMLKQEMLDARIDQTRAIVDSAVNLAIGLQKQSMPTL
jgi:methyl-accepting chemotaxis protein